MQNRSENDIKIPDKRGKTKFERTKWKKKKNEKLPRREQSLWTAGEDGGGVIVGEKVFLQRS